MKIKQTQMNFFWLMFSIILTFVALYSYTQLGYHPTLFIYIGLSILSGAIYFYNNELPIKISKEDCWAIIILFSIVAPFYLYHFDSIPWQINTDEITIMKASQTISEKPGIDILGPSYYLGFAALIFYIFGKISTFLGGIDLYHYRLVHTLSGIIISIAAYAFFRQLVHEKWKALILALWLSSNHALFAISRMAMRDNTGLLVELVCLTLLIYGWKNKSNFSLFWGGVIGGLSFYTYFPSRITMVIWFIFVLAGLYLLRDQFSLKETTKKMLICYFGFFLIIPYMLIATIKQKDLALEYSRQQFLFYSEGRALQQWWVQAATPIDGWITNIKNGLGTFNVPINDLGYIYTNYGHGFVDPLTGIFLWIGIIIILWKWIKGSINFNDLLCLVGFALLYLLFAFLITKAPNYTRLFIILPFVVYLAGQGMFSILNVKNYRLMMSISTAILIAIVLWNGIIFNDFVKVGKKQGQDVGDTARYILARKNEAGHSWILVVDKDHPYYSWGNESYWLDWFGFFAGSEQQSKVMSLNDIASFHLDKSHTLLLSKKAWEDISLDFDKLYPNRHIDKVTPDGNYLAVEVLS